MTETAAQSSIKIKLFLMMILEIAIWGAWQIKIFSYMTMLGFNPDQQWLVGSACLLYTSRCV